MKTKRLIIWKDVPGFEEKYKISNKGEVKSLARKVKHSLYKTQTLQTKLLKPILNAHGYLQVSLYNNGKETIMKIHQLMAIVFLNHTPNKFNLVVNHKDFNKLNNNLENLEIVTNRKNTNRKHLKHSSKYTGVSWNKKAKKWESRIYINGVNKNLGFFENEKDAGKAYKKELKRIY